MTRLVKRLEHAAENRNSRVKETLANDRPERGQGNDEFEDPFSKLARKVRNVRDLFRVSFYVSLCVRTRTWLTKGASNRFSSITATMLPPR